MKEKKYERTGEIEYKEAEGGNTVHCRVGVGEKLTFELKGNTYAQLNAFD